MNARAGVKEKCGVALGWGRSLCVDRWVRALHSLSFIVFRPKGASRVFSALAPRIFHATDDSVSCVGTIMKSLHSD